MDEPNHSTNGLPRTTSGRSKAPLRLTILALTAGLGAILIIWVSRATWERLGNLQHEFATMHAESFYLGVRMHNEVRRLNDTLLRYRLRGDASDYDAFYTEAAELKDWLESNRTNALSELERGFFDHIQGAYANYLNESIKVLESNRASWLASKSRNFQDRYEKVQAQSRQLLSLCDGFIKDQRAAFDDFLQESNRTLSNFQWLLKISLALLLTLAAALVALVYRGMIAPLRMRLTESEAIIARQEKLASLGVLAAGVAHEIRNPLTAIKFRLFSLKKTLAGVKADHEDAAVIDDEISRLERIVQDFLQFARPSEPALVDVPVQRILQEVCELLKPQLDKRSIALSLEPSKPAWVRADTQQIKQVLINLIQNAADSIGQNGKITLRARIEPASSRNAFTGTVIMEVADTGKGIPPEVQARLFDPFFTTKEGGTGLGLPIAARIIEKHGGEIRYQSEPKHGSVFAIHLPRCNQNESKDLVNRG